MRGRVAVGVSTLLLIALPLGGLVGGGYIGYERAKPTEPVCGLYPFTQMFVIAIGALVGLAAGIGIGWALTLVVFRWANGCGLGEIRNVPPSV